MARKVSPNIHPLLGPAWLEENGHLQGIQYTSHMEGRLVGECRVQQSTELELLQEALESLFPHLVEYNSLN